MKLPVNGVEVYVATGGQCFNPVLPTVLFLHGSGLDHQSWNAQAQWFASNGFSVLVPDLPGHSNSRGHACQTIEDSAQWLVDFLLAAQVSEVHVVGHSQGFLTALELSILKPAMLKSLVGVASAAQIAVNPTLIETVSTSKHQAVELMLRWGFGRQMQIESSQAQAQEIIELGRKIMNSNPLAVDLNCCSRYSKGIEAASKTQCPAAMILAEHDKMIPLKSGMAAVTALDAEFCVLKECGHMLPMEAPRQVSAQLKRFILKL